MVFASWNTAKVHRGTWFMYHYGGPTPKRHIAFSNSPWIKKLWMGKLINWAQTKKRLQQEGKAVQLVKKYTDKQGQQRWKGTDKLRGSEPGT